MSMKRVSNIFNRRFVRYGVPFMLLIVGGSFGLQEFAQLRYKFTRHETLSPEELEKHGVKMKKKGEVTLESEFEKLKKIDIDTWENKRGPRPWEEETMQELRERQANKAKSTV